MQQIIINGGKRLKGSVNISGAKNAALPAISAALLVPGITRIKNIPNLKDVTTICSLLSNLGCIIEIDRKKKTVDIDATRLLSHEAPYDLVRTMRASCLVMGPLLARLGKAKVSLPGGCAIGERPINFHLDGFRKLGAEIELDKGYVILNAKKLKGATVYFDIQSVTGTENIMMAALGAEGTTVIENAAKEPEVINLADILNAMGGDIKGAGTDRIVIKGGSELKGIECNVIPDRIETGTFMVAAAITRGDVHIKKCIPEHLDALTLKLREAGVEITTGKNWIKVKNNKEKLLPLNIKTSPFPGFPTDMQAQIMTLMTLADGASVITENIFENRFMHVGELKRMGAEISIESHTAHVNGVDSLVGAPVMATDLRASASLIIAGLAAKGETVISRIYHLDRGYEEIEKKLSSLGADIKRV